MHRGAEHTTVGSQSTERSKLLWGNSRKMKESEYLSLFQSLLRGEAKVRQEETEKEKQSRKVC